MAIAAFISKPFRAAILRLRGGRRRRSKSEHIAIPLRESAEIRSDSFRKVFRFLDANGDGRISAEELASYFASAGDSLSIEEARRIIGEISGCGGDTMLLGFPEFVQTVDLRETEDDRAVLRQAFEVYEVEKGNGCITPEGLRGVLRRLGDEKTARECEAMIRVYDLDGNGVLDFDEFCKMMS